MTLSKVLLIVACVLFVVASLVFGGVLTGLVAWSFMAGALASWTLALVV